MLIGRELYILFMIIWTQFQAFECAKYGVSAYNWKLCLMQVIGVKSGVNKQFPEDLGYQGVPVPTIAESCPEKRISSDF